MEDHIRNVAVREVSNPLDATDDLNTGAIAWQPMKFEQKTYPMFHVEYSLNDGDFVVHFFVRPEFVSKYPEAALRTWWMETFPQHLSPIAMEHFDAKIPRILAKYTEMTASWWFKAQGYVHLVDPLGFLDQFFQKLSRSLDPNEATTSSGTQGSSS